MRGFVASMPYPWYTLYILSNCPPKLPRYKSGPTYVVTSLGPVLENVLQSSRSKALSRGPKFQKSSSELGRDRAPASCCLADCKGGGPIAARV